MNQLKKAVQKKIKSGDVTITDLADRADCSRQMIYNFLNGKNISIELVEKIAAICKLKLTVKNVA